MMSQLSASGIPWTDSSKCCNCSSRFGLLRRRHHCRNCGRTVCSECSSGRVLMDGLLVRCCKDCSGRNSSFIESPPSKILHYPSDPLAGASISFQNTSVSHETIRSKVNASFLLGTELSLSDDNSAEKFIGDSVKMQSRLGEINEEEDDEIPSNEQSNNIPFPINDLSDDPPILEYGGWHPLSGTQEERNMAQKRFGLNLSAVSPEDMRRWYYGDSPWKAALVPPHGGVAFGVSYAGYRPPSNIMGLSSAVYAGRWRLAHLEVLEVGMGPASTIGMALSKPHLEFNQGGAHYVDRVDVPLFGKVSQSRWLVCVYASPNIRLIRCVSGFVDKEEQRFPFALAILRSLTVVDASTNREFTGGDGVRSGKFTQSYLSPRQGRSGSAPIPPNPMTRPLSEGPGKTFVRESSCMVQTPVEVCDRKMVVEIWSPTRGRLLMTLEHAPKAKVLATERAEGGTVQRITPGSPSSIYGGDTLSSLVQKSMALLGLSQSSSDVKQNKAHKEEEEATSKVIPIETTHSPQQVPLTGPSSLEKLQPPPDSIPLDRRERTPPRTARTALRCETFWESSLTNAVNKQVRLLNVGGQDGDLPGPLSASAVSKLPLCAFCGERIMLRALDALGHSWHPNCFTCVHCARPLDAGERFYVDPEKTDGVMSKGNDFVVRSTDNHSVHCYDCFIEVSYPRCFGCLAHIINESVVSAAGQTFHMKCFRCTSCSQNMIKGEGSEKRMVRYFDHNGMIYCEADFLRMFAETCRGCSFNLVKDSPGVVKAVGGLWHRECFVCAECGSALMTGLKDEEGWAVLGGVTYCAEHYEKRVTLEDSVFDDMSGQEPIDSPKQTANELLPERKMSKYGAVLPPSVSELTTPSPAPDRFRQSVVQNVEGNEDAWFVGVNEATQDKKDGEGEVENDMLRSSLVEDFYDVPDTSPVVSPLTTQSKRVHGSSGGGGEADLTNQKHEVKSLVFGGLRWARKSQNRAVHRGKFIRKQIMKELTHKAEIDTDKDVEPASALDVSHALRFGVSALLGHDLPGGYQVISNSMMKSTGRSTSEPRDTSPGRRGMSPERGSTSYPFADVPDLELPASTSDPYFPEHYDYTHMTQITIETSLTSSNVIPSTEKDAGDENSTRLSSMSPITSSAGSSTAVSFEAHAPAVFKAIRRRFFGMSEESYFNTMCKTALSDVTKGAGKSGSYFLYSSDKRLIVKSVRSSEFPFLVRVLEAYVVHMEANHFHSLLPRFLGLYKVKLPRMPAERLLVMNNVFYAPIESRLPVVKKPPPPALFVPPTPIETPTPVAVKEDSKEAVETAPPPLSRRRSISRAVFSAKGRLFGKDSKKKDSMKYSSQEESPAADVDAEPAQATLPSRGTATPTPPLVITSANTITKATVTMPSRTPRVVSEATLRPLVMSQIYDLKGSLLKRFVSEAQQNKGERVLKDLNFCGHHKGTDNKGNAIEKRGLKCRKLRVGKERWASLTAALMSDVEWLRAHNIMDYSLLIGVGMVRKKSDAAAQEGDESEEDVEDGDIKWSHLSASCYSEWVRDTGGLRARDDTEEEKGIVYYLGIIDILQEFNMGKRMESAYKQRLQIMAGKDPGLISAVDASVYAKRFLEFMTNHIE